MMYQDQGNFLLGLLRQRWGDEPRWVLRPNKQYGFYLLFRSAVVPFREVRRLIEDTFGFANGPTFILGEHYDMGDDETAP